MLKNWQWSDFWPLRTTALGYLTLLFVVFTTSFYVYKTNHSLAQKVVVEQKKQAELALDKAGLNHLISIQKRQHYLKIDQTAQQKKPPVLYWLSQFSLIRQALSITDLTVQLEPHRPLSEVMIPITKGRRLYETPAIISGSLSSENELIQLFDLLEETPNTAYTIDGCTLQKQPSTSEKNLSFSCQIRFFYLLTL